MGQLMAVATAPPPSSAPAGETASARAAHRKARLLGLLYMAVALAVFVLFGLGSEGGLDATFRLNAGDPLFTLPDVVLPARGTAMVLGLVCAVLGGIQLSRGFGKRTAVGLAVVTACFVVAFLTWAARGDSMSLIGLLESTLARATPLTLGALAGVLCERSGVVNIAIEGQMLTAAFVGSLVASAANSLWVGVLGAVAIGGLLGFVLAGLSIRYRVDQVIGGTVINIFALGITSFLSASVMSEYQDLNNPGVFGGWSIPLLSDIPILGPLFFEANVFVFAALVLPVLLTFLLFRTRWGLRVRAVGEHPKAADTVGINVYRVRYRSVVLGGMVAGLAGAFFTLGSVGRFDENMTAGRGFIALAALIFGRWHPLGAFGAALVFGFAESLQNRLAILDTPIPSEFLLMAPYLVTILVVAGVVGRSRAPAADGQPYTP
jgi:simple sugar transport system permease protein